MSRGITLVFIKVFKGGGVTWGQGEGIQWLWPGWNHATVGWLRICSRLESIQICGVCEEQQTVKHVLIECNKYTWQWKRTCTAVEDQATRDVTNPPTTNLTSSVNFLQLDLVHSRSDLWEAAMCCNASSLPETTTPRRQEERFNIIDILRGDSRGERFKSLSSVVKEILETFLLI